MKKRIVSIFILAVMTLLVIAVPKQNAYAAAGNLSISIRPDKTEVKPGDIVTYTVTMGGISDFTTAEITLSIPSGLTFKSGSAKAASASTLHAGLSQFTESSKQLCVYGAVYKSSGNTTLMTFQCTVNSNVSGSIGKVTLKSGSYISNSTDDDYSLSVSGTALTVLKPVTGINLSSKALTVHVGKTASLTASAVPGDATHKNNIQFKSSDATVAKVDAKTGAITALKAGKATITASVDGISASCTVTVEGHSWSSWNVTKAASCVTDGQQTHSCTVCGKTETEVIRRSGHNYTLTKVVKEAFCTTTGSELYTCTVCGGTFTKTVLAVGHKWDEGKVEIEATCESDGTTIYTCTECGKALEQTVKGGHQIEKHEAREASCEIDGCLEHYECARCGKFFSDPQGRVEIEDTTGMIFPATDHSWGEWQQTKAPTLTEAGEELRVCENDPEHTETRELEKLVYNVTVPEDSGKGGLAIGCTGSPEGLLSVKLDGSEIPEQYYEVSSDGTVTISREFLNTLASGGHALTLVYDVGEVYTDIAVKETFMRLAAKYWPFAVCGIALVELIVIVVLAVKLKNAKSANASAPEGAKPEAKADAPAQSSDAKPESSSDAPTQSSAKPDEPAI